MNRIILLNSEFNTESGISEVTIDTDLGRFTGRSVASEEDKKYFSSYRGCEYAEIKAIRKYIKANIKKLKAELKTLTTLQSAYESSPKCNKHSREWKILMKAIYQKQDEIYAETNRAESLTKHLLKTIAERDKILQGYYAKKGETVQSN
jgi:hypothetical protein